MKTTADHILRCVDCGVAITQGKRCMAHHHAYLARVRAQSVNRSGFVSPKVTLMESSVVQLLAQGFSINDLSERWGIHPRTISNCVSMVSLRLKSGSGKDLMLASMCIGLDRFTEDWDYRIAAPMKPEKPEPDSLLDEEEPQGNGLPVCVDCGVTVQRGITRCDMCEKHRRRLARVPQSDYVHRRD